MKRETGHRIAVTSKPPGIASRYAAGPRKERAPCPAATDATHPRRLAATSGRPKSVRAAPPADRIAPTNSPHATC
eukprot:7179597-Prymnesium_polylepis.1